MPTEESRCSIRIRGVTKRFGQHVAMGGLDLDIERGSLCGLLGPNGAGKSTTIRMIMSIIHPDEGSLEVLGSTALAAKDRIGYLPEERGLYRKMKVGEFLHYVGRLKGLSSREARRTASEWLERLELPGVLAKKCEELSKGMQQKVQFAAAVMHEPELLILDEPFSGLDPVNARTLVAALREIHGRGATILFSTHQMHQAEALCDRIVLFNRGRKILDESLESIRGRFDPRTLVAEPIEPDAPETVATLAAIEGVESIERVGDAYELRLAAGADSPSVLAAAAAAAPLRGATLRRVSLDDVFVELVGEHPEAIERRRLQEASAA